MAGSRYQRSMTNGDNLVKSQKSTIYFHAGREALYKIIDIRLLDYEWMLKWSYENTSDNTFTQTNTMTTTLRTRTGQENLERFGVSAGFSNMGITATTEAGVEQKKFIEEETTATTQSKQTYTVNPHSSIYIYQKVYNFEADVWFKLDAYNDYWTVGNYERDGVANTLLDIEIHANEFQQTGQVWTGISHLRPVTVQSKDEKTNIKRFENCTGRAQDYLHTLGY
ncbi:hypothetical protein BDV27DRAFT_140328 [Aspergillus caelatus]|uniref:Uncharacterized protein n=1 Tax=Aspergillus caelatus TaxID=61420 RepID=A0A5N7AP23_9EURO|nr:uncharacterized protein BDV27DRAFT_140328 [Aspergillus caelatus]KAE8370738.1 hypothetical protein BDV27DRAFT_140328 [Aspergillus caelatus]